VFSSFGPTELIIVLVIVLLIFGPKRLPGLGRSLGNGMREFKDSIASKHDEEAADDEHTDAERPRPALEQTAATNHDEAVRTADAERTPQP
jgi:sec-independent protein translocase protein TatA